MYIYRITEKFQGMVTPIFILILQTIIVQNVVS